MITQNNDLITQNNVFIKRNYAFTTKYFTISGDLEHLGHLDYYPSGGSSQPGCQIGGPDYLQDRMCSNSRYVK